MTVTRPALRYFGGKWMMAPWVIANFPPHRTYLEPFGGAASVLLRKPRSFAEIYNDLDVEVVSFFRVLRDEERARKLQEALRLTPFAREELDASYDPSDDPVENARRLVVRSYLGFGSNSAHTGRNGANSTGFRSLSRQSGSTPSSDWRNYPGAMDALIDRLRGVTIENRDATELILQHDHETTLHFVDPPYLPETRSRRNPHCKKGTYRHEMTVDDHVALLGVLSGLEGMVVLAGYPSKIYDQALPGWKRIEKTAYADGGRKRTETLWINPAAEAAVEKQRMRLL